MVVKIVLMVLLAASVLFIMLDVVPAHEAYGLCSSHLSTNFTRIDTQARDRNWSRERECPVAFTQLNTDLVCLDQVRSEYVSAPLVFWFTPNRPKINNTLRRHNQACHALKIPIYELDITTVD